jgi:hypothetical protein
VNLFPFLPLEGGHKCFKGLTDELLAWQTRELLAREVARQRFTVLVIRLPRLHVPSAAVEE